LINVILLQAMMFLPIFLLIILSVTFISIYLISNVINAILRIVKKNNPLEFNSLKIATISTLICLIGLVIWIYAMNGKWIN
jgi:hypothetical protein